MNFVIRVTAKVSKYFVADAETPEQAMALAHRQFNILPDGTSEEYQEEGKFVDKIPDGVTYMKVSEEEVCNIIY